MEPVTLRRRWRHARERTKWVNLKTDIIPAVLVGIVAAGASIYLGDQSDNSRVSNVWISAVAGIVALILYWIVANAVQFGWNLWRAGDHLAMADRDECLVALELALSVAEANAAARPTDHEILKLLTPRAKALMTAFKTDLVAGRMAAVGFDAPVVAQMTEFGLMTIAYGTPGPNALARYAVPYINLTVDGARVLGKMAGYEAPEEARTSEGWQQYVDGQPVSTPSRAAKEEGATAQ